MLQEITKGSVPVQGGLASLASVLSRRAGSVPEGLPKDSQGNQASVSLPCPPLQVACGLSQNWLGLEGASLGKSE